MMRLQYDSLIDKIFKLIDDELELDTAEGQDVFRELGRALFAVYVRGKL